MTANARRRTGFTLLELLVVIAIIAILLGLSMGAVMRVRLSQQVRSTTTTVEKLQVAVDNQYKAIIAQAQIDIRSQATQDAQAMINYFNGDTDAALAYLTYARVRQSFPQTFAEIQTAPLGTLPSFKNSANQTVPYFTVGGYIFPVKSQFLPLSTVSSAGLNESQQSGALLFAAVSQTGAGGSAFNSDDVLAGNQLDFQAAGSAVVRVYIDAWKQPIGFARFGTNSNPTLSNNLSNNVPSLQDAPFVNTSSSFQDPLDPSGKLQTLGAPTTYLFVTTPADIANATSFNGSNRRPVVYSTGPNMTYESLNMVRFNENPSDDILGYQFTQLGGSGIR